VGEARTCPDCGKPLEWRDEPCYYFRLSAYESRLKEHIAANPHFIEPEVRRNETLGFIAEGLQDVAVTRTGTDWGVPVPDEESGGVIYVWFDALLNYLTATGWLERDGDAYLDTWPPDLQLMGKDILPRFHATIWPAMLMALGLPLPLRLYGHGWFLVNQQKMSKSLGNVYAPLEVVQALARLPVASRPLPSTPSATICYARCPPTRIPSSAWRGWRRVIMATWRTIWAIWCIARCR
jgi:methionyl-tRNA synthetase